VRDEVTSRGDRAAADTFLRLEAAYRAHEDLIAVGAYKSGTDPLVDAALALRAQTEAFLRQEAGDASTPEETWRRLTQLAAAHPALRGGIDA
jgi:flagellum-specific ATP synthase